MKHHHLLTLLVFALSATASAVYADEAAPQATAPTVDRTVLPIPEPDYPKSIALDARDATSPPRFQVKVL